MAMPQKWHQKSRITMAMPSKMLSEGPGSEGPESEGPDSEDLGFEDPRSEDPGS